MLYWLPSSDYFFDSFYLSLYILNDDYDWIIFPSMDSRFKCENFDLLKLLFSI